MSQIYVTGTPITYGTITPDGTDNSVSSTTPTAGGGTKLTWNNAAPAASLNSATQQFVSGDDVNQSYGSMEPQPNPGNCSTVTTVAKGTSTTAPSFTGTNRVGASNIPAAGYSQEWKGGR